MINWGSAILGAASSLLVSMFMLHYQNWKANVRDRVSIFYRARKQIRLNLEALDLSRSAPDRKAILQEKIQFLPAYPFSNDDHTDEAFRALSEYYDTELLYAISGDINYSEFEKNNFRTTPSPGSDAEFMDRSSTRWNISLLHQTYHYRVHP